MDFFIKKIFDGKTDEFVHLQFQKFSRGNFNDKALVRAKNSKGKYSINTTYEYANEIVRSLAEKLGNNKTKINGVIVSTKDLKGEVDFSGKKQFAGVKQYIITKEMTGNEIISIIDKFPKAFIALSFTVGENELKIKAKAPKSGKPSTKTDEKIAPDFCKLKTTDKELARSMLFDLDIESFKEVEVRHAFIIEDIEIPAGEKDPEKMRENAVRIGKIVRRTKVDDKETTKEVKFRA